MAGAALHHHARHHNIRPHVKRIVQDVSAEATYVSQGRTEPRVLRKLRCPIFDVMESLLGTA